MKLKKSMIDRDIAYRNWKHSKSDVDAVHYKSLRNRVNGLVKNAKDGFNKRTINLNIPSKQLWSNIKRLGLTSKQNSSVICENSANEINDYFSSNYTRDEESSAMHIPANSSGFQFRTVLEHEIINALFSIKSNAIGLDNIPIKFLRIIMPLAIKLFVHLFNKIITTSKFPQGWKYVKVIPIKKQPRSSLISNLRPITLLSTLSKVFEKILKSQISDYVTEMNFLNPFQSGFRKNHSTETALLKVHDDIALAVDKKGIAILLLIDFAKAFDSVSHGKLLRKLVSKFGFSQQATSLLKTYLCGRFQAVEFNGALSSFQHIDSGVPQGSVLGPLLFSLFINDLPSVLDYCSVHLFADDVQVYLCAPENMSIARISRMINHDLQKISGWSRRNQLPINPSKTKAMLMCRLKTPPSPPELYLNDEVIQFVDRANNLGVIFRSNLQWDAQINSQVGKIYGTLKQLSLVTKDFDSPTKIRLFQTLVYPHFIYGDFIYTNATMSSLDRLRVALNACVRYVFNISRFNRVSHLQKDLLGCPFAQFYKFRSCVALFRLIKTKKPYYLYSKLKPCRNIRTKSFLIPQHNSAYYSQSQFARGIVYWNQLPLAIKTSISKHSFKQDLLSLLNT